jgi:hypothetical protein
MATRFYLSDINGLPSSNVLVGFPAPAALWDSTSLSSRKIMGTAAQFILNEATNVQQQVSESVTTRDNRLIRQFISHTLAAQTISGTVKGQIRCTEGTADADMAMEFSLRVISRTDGTVRGTLYQTAGSGTIVPAYEFDSSGLVNRYMPPGGSQAVTSVNAQQGDLLVLEVGVRAYNTILSAKTATIRYGYSAARSDLPEDQTDTNDYNAWLELSHDILWDDTITLDDGIYDDLLVSDCPPGIVVPSAGQVWPRGNYAS